MGRRRAAFADFLLLEARSDDFFGQSVAEESQHQSRLSEKKWLSSRTPGYKSPLPASFDSPDQHTDVDKVNEIQHTGSYSGLLLLLASGVGVAGAGYWFLSQPDRGGPPAQAASDTSTRAAEDAPGAAEDAPPMQAQETAQDSDQALQEGLNRARAADLQANTLVSALYQKAAPLAAKVGSLQGMVDERMESVRTRVPQVLNEELEAATAQLKEVIQSEMPQVDLNVQQYLPPLSICLAGLAAPAQLKWLYGDNLGRITVNGLLCAIDLIALYISRGKPCISHDVPWFETLDLLHAWVGIDAAALLFTLGVSGMIHFRSSATLAEVEAQDAQALPQGLTQEERFRALLENKLLAGAQAMYMYDSLTASTTYRLLPVVSVFQFFWQINGWFLLFDTPGATCSAATLLYWARSRGIVFLIGLVPMICGLLLTGLKVAANSPEFAEIMLKVAMDLDTSFFPEGLPVFTVLLRAFFLRDATDMAGVELQVLRAEEQRLRRDRDAARSEQESLAVKLATLEAEAAAAAAKVEEQAAVAQQDVNQRAFMHRYRQAVSEVINPLDQATALAQAAATGDAVGALGTLVGGSSASSASASALEATALPDFAAALQLPSLEAAGSPFALAAASSEGLLAQAQAAASAAASSGFSPSQELLARAQAAGVELAAEGSTGGSGAFNAVLSSLPSQLAQPTPPPVATPDPPVAPGHEAAESQPPGGETRDSTGDASRT